MGARLGHDFSDVRVHTGAEADQAATSVGALAFTWGRDIVFRAGEFAPTAAAGRTLLAHELVHVSQQHSSPRLLRKPDPEAKKVVRFNYSVAVNEPLDSDQLLLELIKQYKGVATDAEAAAIRDADKWVWVGKPQVATDADVAKGYVLVPITDHSITPGDAAETKQRADYFKGLAPGDQSKINAEVDR